MYRERGGWAYVPLCIVCVCEELVGNVLRLGMARILVCSLEASTGVHGSFVWPQHREVVLVTGIWIVDAPGGCDAMR